MVCRKPRHAADGFRPDPPRAPAVAEAYVATRLAGERGRTTGAIGAVDTDMILSRL